MKKMKAKKQKVISLIKELLLSRGFTLSLVTKVIDYHETKGDFSNKPIDSSKLDELINTAKKFQKLIDNDEKTIPNTKKIDTNRHSKSTITSVKKREKSNKIYSSNHPKTNSKYLSLSDEQVGQILNTGTEDGINKILNDKNISISNEQRFSLTKRLLELCNKPKVDTIKYHSSLSKIRTNQTYFRDIGLQYYQMCVISGYKTVEILDASHIEPANGFNDTLDNCLILRKDIHKLFDSYLISIDTESMKVVVSTSIMDEYGMFHNKILQLYANIEKLKEHYSIFLSKNDKQ